MARQTGGALQSQIMGSDQTYGHHWDTHSKHHKDTLYEGSKRCFLLISISIKCVSQWFGPIFSAAAIIISVYFADISVIILRMTQILGHCVGTDK
jgi:hypothetical protein